MQVSEWLVGDPLQIDPAVLVGLPEIDLAAVAIDPLVLVVVRSVPAALVGCFAGSVATEPAALALVDSADFVVFARSVGSLRWLHLVLLVLPD